MIKYRFLYFTFLGLVCCLFFDSCQILNKSRMLRTPRNFVYEEFPDSTVYEQYKIAPDDILNLRIFSNNGFKVVNFSEGNNTNTRTSSLNGNTYRVNAEGFVKIPVIGEIKVLGLNIKQVETLFEEELKSYYNNPFVIIEITNKRVFVFQGGNSATVVQLQNENTTLFEVLALAGGISLNGNAAKIKLIRGNLRMPTIHLVDLSTIEGVKNADLIMQANDIIYVEPFYNYASMITSDLTTLLSLTSTVLLTINLISKN